MATKKVKNADSSPVSAEEKVVEISKDLSTFEKRQNKIVAISDDKTLQNANDFLIDVKGRVNRIKALKTEYLAPLKASVKKIEELFNNPLKKYELVEYTVKRAMSDYRLEQDKIARAEEERIKQEQEKKLKEAEKKGNPAPVMPVVAVERKETTMRTESGKSSAKKVVKFEVTDPSAIPPKLREKVYELAVMKGLLDQVIRPMVAMDGMKTNIKGVRVYEDFDISVSA